MKQSKKTNLVLLIFVQKKNSRRQAAKRAMPFLKNRQQKALALPVLQGGKPIALTCGGKKVFLGLFRKTKEQDSSFSEEKEAKRLLCLVLFGLACQAMETGPASRRAPHRNAARARNACIWRLWPMGA